MQWAHWFAGMLDTRPDDRMYDCLPMYHSVGGIVATGALLVNGGSVVIRERFSTRDFWDDVVDTECTLFQYIGELCRFLVNAPPHPREREHRLRACCGNGLAAGVWEAFQHRFRIPRILEFYAATEANFSLYNAEGKLGAIGRVPAFLSHRFPVALVRFDAVAGAPARDVAGRCVRVAVDEAGEAISRITDDGTAPQERFDGYSDAAASDQKVLRDVFAPGDRWYRTGDLMRKDAQGFFYFVDRVGDTVRWKGENVSMAEVGDAVAGCAGVREAVAFGVAVPGADGRAVMAAVVAEPGFDLGAFRDHAAARLPGVRAAAFCAHRRRDRRDGDVQADEGRTRPRWIRSVGDERCLVRSRSRYAGVRARGRGAVRADSGGCGALLSRGPARPTAYAVDPASTVSVTPVMLRALSPSRNSTAFATSSGSARRRSAARRTTRSCCRSGSPSVMSVSMNPGATAFTVMPSLPTSRASARVKPTRDALLAPYTESPLNPVAATIDATLTIRPAPSDIIGADDVLGQQDSAKRC